MRVGTGAARQRIRGAEEQHEECQQIYSSDFPGITSVRDVYEIDPVMLAYGIPLFVSKVMDGDAAEGVAKLAQVSKEKWFTIVEVLLNEEFLKRLWELLTTAEDEALVENALTLLTNMWWAGSDEILFRVEFVQAIFGCLERRQCVVLCIRGLINYASHSKANAKVLVDMSIVGVLGGVVSQMDLQAESKYALMLLHALYVNIDTDMYPVLNDLVPFVIRFVSSRYPECRVEATECVRCAMEMRDSYRCLMENDLVTALHRAQQVNPVSQSHALYSIFRRIIEIEGPRAVANEQFITKFYRIMSADKAEYIASPDSYPVICGIMRMMMQEYHEEFYNVGVVRQLARMSVDGTAIVRIETATTLASFLTFASPGRVHEVLDAVTLAPVLDLISEAPEQQMLMMLRSIARLKQDGIIDFDEQLMSLLASLREQDISRDCADLITLLLSSP